MARGALLCAWLACVAVPRSAGGSGGDFAGASGREVDVEGSEEVRDQAVRAEAAQRAGRCAEAIQGYESLLASMEGQSSVADQSPLLLNLARCHERRGDMGHAARFFTAALSLRPFSKTALLGLLNTEGKAAGGRSCRSGRILLELCRLGAVTPGPFAPSRHWCTRASVACPQLRFAVLAVRGTSHARRGRFRDASAAFSDARAALLREPPGPVADALPLAPSARDAVDRAAAWLALAAATARGLAASPRPPRELWVSMHTDKDAERILDAHFERTDAALAALAAQSGGRLELARYRGEGLALTRRERPPRVATMLSGALPGAVPTLATVGTRGAVPVLDTRVPANATAAFVFDRCHTVGRDAFWPLELPPLATVVRWEDECGAGQCRVCANRADVFAFAYDADVPLHAPLLGARRGLRLALHAPQPADAALYPYAAAAAAGRDGRAPGAVQEYSVRDAVLTGEADALFRLPDEGTAVGDMPVPAGAPWAEDGPAPSDRKTRVWTTLGDLEARLADALPCSNSKGDAARGAARREPCKGWAPMYPFRQRLRALLASPTASPAGPDLAGLSLATRKHPGYRQFACGSSDTCSEVNATAASHAAERASYAAQLLRARLAVVTAAAPRYLLRKYAEAAAAGAVAVGDLPATSLAPALRHVVSLDWWESSRAHARRIRWWARSARPLRTALAAAARAAAVPAPTELRGSVCRQAAHAVLRALRTVPRLRSAALAYPLREVRDNSTEAALLSPCARAPLTWEGRALALVGAVDTWRQLVRDTDRDRSSDSDSSDGGAGLGKDGVMTYRRAQSRGAARFDKEALVRAFGGDAVSACPKRAGGGQLGKDMARTRAALAYVAVSGSLPPELDNGHSGPAAALERATAGEAAVTLALGCGEARGSDLAPWREALGVAQAWLARAEAKLDKAASRGAEARSGQVGDAEHAAEGLGSGLNPDSRASALAAQDRDRAATFAATALSWAELAGQWHRVSVAHASSRRPHRWETMGVAPTLHRYQALHGPSLALAARAWRIAAPDAVSEAATAAAEACAVEKEEKDKAEEEEEEGACTLWQELRHSLSPGQRRAVAAAGQAAVGDATPLVCDMFADASRLLRREGRVREGADAEWRALAAFSRVAFVASREAVTE